MHMQATSEYLFLIRGVTSYEALSPDEMQSEIQKFMSWVDGLKNQGALKTGQPLFAEGRVVTGSKAHGVSDGPFVETKEAVGGYLLIEADSLEEAVEMAKTCPVLSLGLYLEVRPVAERCPLMVDEGDLAEATA